MPPGSTAPTHDLDDGQFTLSLHGAPVALACHVPNLQARLDWLLNEFRTPLPGTAGRPAVNSIAGSIAPFDIDLALGRLPSVVRPWAHRGDELVTLFQHGERFWMIDERWGLCEMDLLRGSWRSWVLPQPRVNPMRCAELAALWPLAQLLRGRGMHLVPAASVARGNWAALLLCPYSIEPELTLLVRHGYRLIGQRWTAIAERGGRPVLLHMPGWVERPENDRASVTPARRRALGRRRSAWLGRMGPLGPAGRLGVPNPVQCVDLTGNAYLRDGPAATGHAAAPCDAVLVIEPGRSTAPRFTELQPTEAAVEIRRAWPIADLHPARVASPFPSRLAAGTSQCARVHLSRDPAGLLRVLDTLRGAPPQLLPARPRLTLSTLLPAQPVAPARPARGPKLSLPPAR